MMLNLIIASVFPLDRRAWSNVQNPAAQLTEHDYRPRLQNADLSDGL
jgi:hypothetical protein